MLKTAKKILCVLLAYSLFFATIAWAKITIYMCGDSTMQDWAEGYYPKQGMGQDFAYFFDSDYVTVYNAGRGGTTSQTYYESHWSSDFTKNGVTYPAVGGLVSSGDYVFIMFGANDNGYKTGEENFRLAISSMVEETQAVGAYPILLSPIRRSNFTSSDSVYESYHAYPIYMRQVADSLGVPLIDLDTLSRNLLLSVGEYYSHYYINMYIDSEYSNYSSGQSDNQHLQQNGANAMGRIVTEQLRVHSDETAKALSNYLAPMYQVDVATSPEGASLYTSFSTYYPEGMTVTLRTTPQEDGPAFIGWYDGDGNLVTTNSESTVTSEYIHTFVMGNASTKYTAVYEGGEAELYTGTGAARTSFPTSTPKTLEGFDVDTTTTGTTDEESEETAEVELLSIFDAAEPDTFDVGYSENEHTGFSGAGYWNFENAEGSFASYDLVFPSAGYVTLGIAYANGGTSDRQINAYLDHDYYVSCPATGGWDVWDTVYVEVDLMKGEGTLEFISMTSDGGPNIDMFGFSIAGVTRQSAASEDTLSTDTLTTDTLTTDSLTSGGLASLRNSLGSSLHGNLLTLSQDAEVSLYSMSGKKLASRRVQAGNVSLETWAKASGVYRVVVRSAAGFEHFNWANVR